MLRMRSWTGYIFQQFVAIKVVSAQDDHDIVLRLVVNMNDDILQSLGGFLIRDDLITQNPSFFWAHLFDDMNQLEQRLHLANEIGAQYLAANRLRIVSVFSFMTYGPTIRGQQARR